MWTNEKSLVSTLPYGHRGVVDLTNEPTDYPYHTEATVTPEEVVGEITKSVEVMSPLVVWMDNLQVYGEQYNTNFELRTEIEKWIDSTGVKRIHGVPVDDVHARPNGIDAATDLRTGIVHIPLKKYFRDQDAYYTVQFHEMTHWARWRDRGPIPIPNRKAMAYEELVAGIGQAIIAEHWKLDWKKWSVLYVADWLIGTFGEIRLPMIAEPAQSAIQSVRKYILPGR